VGDFFHGWRRKAGVLTLVMACMCLAVWVRSFASTNDYFTVWNNHAIYSHDGSVSWNIQYPDDSTPIESENQSENQPMSILLGTHIGSPFVLQTNPRLKWRWECCGFVASDTVFFGSGMQQYWLSDWYFISPLALLSAWLLLSKPRTTNPKKAVEPATAERA